MYGARLFDFTFAFRNGRRDRTMSDKLREGLANWLGERLRPGMDRHYQAEQLIWVLKNELFAEAALASTASVGLSEAQVVDILFPLEVLWRTFARAGQLHEAEMTKSAISQTYAKLRALGATSMEAGDDGPTKVTT